MADANATCIIAQYRGFLVHGSLPFAVCIILILSYIQRTKKERQPGGSRNPFRNVFSLIYAIDLFDNHDRLPHCLAFGAASSMILDLTFGDYQSYFFGQQIPGWSKILVGTFVTIEIAVDCFPFFACITCKSRLVANAVGFFYLASWFIMMLLLSIGCQEINQELVYPLLMSQLPVFICLFLLTVYFLGMFISILIQRRKGTTFTGQERLYKTHQAIYVRNLFNKPKEIVYTGWRAKLFKNYKPHPGFIYPTRVLMPCFVSIVGLYQVAFWFLPIGVNLIGAAVGTLTGLAQGRYSNDTETLGHITAQLDQVHTGLLASWWIAAGFSILIPLLYIPQILQNYRNHLLSMWSGTSQLMKDVKLNSTDSVVGSLKYIGFQVAVFLTGYMFIHGILFLFIGVLTIAVLFCIWDFQMYFVGSFLVIILPSTIIGFGVMSSQDLLVKYFFIQDKLNPDDEDKPLALKHRVWFLILSYVTMFLNTLYGLIFAIMRVVIGLIISMLLLPRIDRPIWVPGFGDKDLVFVIYAGNLFTENAHSNPILVMFCHMMVFDILKKQRKQAKQKQLTNHPRHRLVSNEEPPYTDLESVEYNKGPTHLLKYFRWHLAYTLIKNPSLIKLRKRTAILTEQDMVVLDGEAMFVNAGKGNGDGGHRMLPHIVEVMKRQNLEMKSANSDVLPSVAQPSVNALDPGLIVLEDPPEYPEATASNGPANPVIRGTGGTGPSTSGSESNA